MLRLKASDVEALIVLADQCRGWEGARLRYLGVCPVPRDDQGSNSVDGPCETRSNAALVSNFAIWVLWVHDYAGC